MTNISIINSFNHAQLGSAALNAVVAVGIRNQNCFMSLEDLAKRCESLGDGRSSMCQAAKMIIDELYLSLSDAIRDKFVIYSQGVQKISALGLAMLASRMPHLFADDDLEFLLIEMSGGMGNE